MSAKAIAVTSSPKVRSPSGRRQSGVEPGDDVALPHRQIPGRLAHQGRVPGTEHDTGGSAEHQHRYLTGQLSVDHPDPVPGPVEALSTGNRHQAEPATGQPASPPRDGLRQFEAAHLNLSERHLDDRRQTGGERSGQGRRIAKVVR